MSNEQAECEFSLRLPLAHGACCTHVVELAGSEARFSRTLQARLSGDLLLASALFGPVATVSLGELADLLNSIGHATVLSIDPL